MCIVAKKSLVSPTEFTSFTKEEYQQSQSLHDVQPVANAFCASLKHQLFYTLGIQNLIVFKGHFILSFCSILKCLPGDQKEYIFCGF